MARKANQRIKNINNSVRRQAVILRDALGPFTEAFGVVVVGVIFLVIAFILGIGSPSDWASFFASFMVAAITIFFIRRSTYRHSMLIEVTMSYLVEGGKPFLDHLLGKLISGTWHGEDFKPGNALFKVVEEICLGQTIIFTGGGADTYEWDMGVEDGDEFEPLTTGVDTYTVTGTSEFGCVNTASVDVTVSPLPICDFEFIVNGVSSEDGGTGGCVESAVQFNDLSKILQ